MDKAVDPAGVQWTTVFASVFYNRAIEQRKCLRDGKVQRMMANLR